MTAIVERPEIVPMLIDGRDIVTGATFDVLYPGDGSRVARIAAGNAEIIQQAVTAAQRAFPAWAALPAFKRAEVLFASAALLLERKEAIARDLTAESGKPITDSLGEVARTVELIHYAGEEAKRFTGEIVPVDAVSNGANRFGYTRREPLGVIAAITPFNFPLALVAHKIAPALAVGNTVVLKPASATPLTALNIGRIFLEAGLPPGALNVIAVSGSETDALIRNPDVQMISFTGSAPVGEHIRQIAGLRRVALELGSNSATIVHSDANLGAAALAASKAAYSFAGQVCISLQRIYVQKSVEQAFLENLTQRVQAIHIGDPFDSATEVGPMLTEQEAIRAELWIREAVAAGAKIACGGARNGAYVTPTVLTHVTPDMKVVCEEIFAPVVSIVAYDTIDDAIAMVNDSQFGLQAGIYTNDIATAFAAAARLHVGGVMINDTCRFRADNMPYGGVKRSGMGREGVVYAMEEMSEIKMVVFNLNDA